MTRFEKGAVIAHGLNIYRPVQEESFARLVGALPNFKYGDEIEMRSFHRPGREPTVHIMPRGWFRDCQLVPDVSLDGFEGRIRDPLPALDKSILLDATYELLKTRSGERYLLAVPVPADERVLQAERHDILNIANQALASYSMPVYRRPIDLTLGYIPQDPDRRLVEELEQTLPHLATQRNIELGPLIIEPTLPSVTN